MGKTGFAISILKNICFDGDKRCLYFSRKVNEERLVERIIDSIARYDWDSDTKDEDIDVKDKYWTVADCVMDAELIVDSISSTPREIEIALKSHLSYGPVDMVIIDDLQEVYRESSMGQNGSKEYVLSELKNMAEKYKCPILLLSNIGRSVEKRKDHWPGLPDIRKEANYEKYADRIIFLYRPDYYDPKDHSKTMNVAIAYDKYNDYGSYIRLDHLGAGLLADKEDN